jgi:hypothetical protein
VEGDRDIKEEARNNLTEKIELFLEVADPSEIVNRLKSEPSDKSHDLSQTHRNP